MGKVSGLNLKYGFNDYGFNDLESLAKPVYDGDTSIYPSSRQKLQKLPEDERIGRLRQKLQELSEDERIGRLSLEEDQELYREICREIHKEMYGEQ